MQGTFQEVVSTNINHTQKHYTILGTYLCQHLLLEHTNELTAKIIKQVTLSQPNGDRICTSGILKTYNDNMTSPISRKDGSTKAKLPLQNSPQCSFVVDGVERLSMVS
jgi:hypothetical protein